jgi:hypothetical protein
MVPGERGPRQLASEAGGELKPQRRERIIGPGPFNQGRTIETPAPITTATLKHHLGGWIGERVTAPLIQSRAHEFQEIGCIASVRDPYSTPKDGRKGV